MRALVTGGAGFIGSHLTEALVARGDSVRVIDALLTGREENLAPVRNRIEFIKASLLEPDALQRAVRDIDVVFHEAAIPSVTRSVDDPVECHLNGVHATLLLLDAARRAKVKRVVFAASSSTYGESPELPKRESALPDPISPYAATKTACESYMRSFARCYEIDTACLRYFNIYGPRQDPSSQYSGVIARFCDAFKHDRQITIYGDGEQTRDFTYVLDAVQANLLAADAKTRINGDVINVACGRQTSLNELLRTLNTITGESRQAQYLPARAGDVKHSLADITRAKTILGYSPRTALEEGLGATLAATQ